MPAGPNGAGLARFRQFACRNDDRFRLLPGCMTWTGMPKRFSTSCLKAEGSWAISGQVL